MKVSIHFFLRMAENYFLRVDNDGQKYDGSLRARVCRTISEKKIGLNVQNLRN